jgi:hypothetical protein
MIPNAPQKVVSCKGCKEIQMKCYPSTFERPEKDSKNSCVNEKFKIVVLLRITINSIHEYIELILVQYFHLIKFDNLCRHRLDK